MDPVRELALPFGLLPESLGVLGSCLACWWRVGVMPVYLYNFLCKSSFVTHPPRQIPASYQVMISSAPSLALLCVLKGYSTLREGICVNDLIAGHRPVGCSSTARHDVQASNFA